RPEVLAQPPATVILLSAFLIAHDAVPAAVDLLREAQQRHPGDFWINVELSISLSKMKPPRDDEALSFDRAALAIRPQSPSAHFALGNTLNKLGRTREAVAASSKAVELDPHFADAYPGLSSTLLEQGDLTAALKAARKAMELKPGATAYNTLGMVLIEQNQLPEAVAALRKAIELKPKFFE